MQSEFLTRQREVDSEVTTMRKHKEQYERDSVTLQRKHEEIFDTLERERNQLRIERDSLEDKLAQERQKHALQIRQMSREKSGGVVVSGERSESPVSLTDGAYSTARHMRSSDAYPPSNDDSLPTPESLSRFPTRLRDDR